MVLEGKLVIAHPILVPSSIKMCSAQQILEFGLNSLAVQREIYPLKRSPNILWKHGALRKADDCEHRTIAWILPQVCLPFGSEFATN